MFLMRFDMRAPAFSSAPPAELYAAALEMAAEIHALGELPARRTVVLTDNATNGWLTPMPNPELIARLGELRSLERPVLVGPSRKSFIGKTLDLPVEGRLMGTAAAVAACVLGGAHIVRVHEVEEMAQVSGICDALLEVQP